MSIWPLEELVQDSKSREHRMRVLEHQAKLAAEAGASGACRPQDQRNFPLIVEVTSGGDTKPAARRARRKQRVRQPGFEGL